LYLQQLKIAIEEEKLRDNIARLEKQINKEKKLIRRGRTRGLRKEHEVKPPGPLLLGFLLAG
jgi:nesprin-2